MSNRALDELLELVAAAASADDPVARDLRSAACLAMFRLSGLAGGERPSAAERAHLSVCRLCSERLAAFRRSRLRFARPAPHRWSLTAARLAAALAAAAVLFVSLVMPQSRSARSPGTQRPNHTPLVFNDDAKLVALSVSPVSCVGDADPRRIERFVTEANQPCLVAAAYRACDESCDCQCWELHKWDDAGRTLRAVTASEPVEIALDLPPALRVRQLLILAFPRHSGSALDTEHEAADLLDCLAILDPPVCANMDPATYMATAQTCLPRSVAVYEQTFYRN